MKTGHFERRLRRGIKADGKPQLYVRRRTTHRGSNRVLLSLGPSLRYAVCVWSSYRSGFRGKAVSQEIRRMVEEAFRRRLGPDWETIIEEAYEAYSKQCADNGEVNIFEVA